MRQDIKSENKIIF